jgi:hypothetical protein
MCSINHDKKAIFIHIPKTGGTFIRENLEKYYGFKFYVIKRADHDVFCNISKLDKERNQVFKDFVANRNHGILKYAKTSNYINRMINMNREKWKTYKIFCFVRNPYDRLISGWNFLKSKHGISSSFEEFIFKENVVSDFEYIHSFMSQYDNMIDENNKFKINYLGKFENIEEDFKNILLNLGFSEEEIKHDKEKKNNFTHQSYKELINTQEILDKVNIICQKDFENFFYKKVEKIVDFTNLDYVVNKSSIEFLKYMLLGGPKNNYEPLNYNFYNTLLLFPELEIFKNNLEGIKNELMQNIGVMNDWLLKDKNDKFYSKHTIIPIYGYKKWSKYSKDFPITVGLIKCIKDIETCCFLKLAKNARLDKHYGYNPSSNYILRNHLGLKVPQNCGMWVDNEIRMHVEGEWLTFDDSKLHTAFNNSGDDRYILLIDLLRPDFIMTGNSLRDENNNDNLIEEFILENADGDNDVIE